MTETLAHGYSSDSTQRELCNEYQHDRFFMVFKNLSVLVLWMKVALASEGLAFLCLSSLVENYSWNVGYLESNQNLCRSDGFNGRKVSINWIFSFPFTGFPQLSWSRIPTMRRWWKPLVERDILWQGRMNWPELWGNAWQRQNDLHWWTSW